ncbi:UDP-N-acetyl-D-mannosaminuronate dehydrogenase [Desulfosporosinus acidiphilus SJ4]|uniref:UDP-N-acetyl-D-mannosaminuronate dehydrogenase n=1 Tax=Desulfosporosinus acidiphilus (strain DSM 22704 / JCM 16185 / SJ4) TaxID=646529 RepID=I4D1L4_DESAJ|nr:UDP-N-acetyl-D-mannosaminuronate dehydrogenase [Desulfosporosinus acidiphilus]AFM39688.1 UDP-N-acetyl-D-mannosaminuronate dehydrogenase [Desulfosporosinus acidiphilus SJ4]
MKICVVGLGNIGFNLFTFLCEKFPGEVSGVDVNRKRVQELRRQGYEVTDNYGDLVGIDVWLMAPSTGSQAENLFAALEEMIIHPGCLISVESTLPPGTMSRVRDFLEKKGFQLGTDIFLIHVPHRVMFGVDKTVCDSPRVMGAFTGLCLEKGREFYSPLVPELMEVADIRVAELSKVIENVKRYVDIAFAEEIYSYCVDQALDFEDLRRAVNSKSNVELLGTDWGIGGECLPKDLGFLQSVCASPLLEGAEKADQNYRDKIVRQVGSGKEVLVKGVSYKAGVKDLKYSRASDLIKALEAAGNTVWVEDPLFSSNELHDAGFNTCQTEPNNKNRQLTPNRIILERQKALNLSKTTNTQLDPNEKTFSRRLKKTNFQDKVIDLIQKNLIGTRISGKRSK